MNILFVCTGNTCRSPMAAALMDKVACEKDLDVRIDSAGTGVFGSERASENAVKAVSRLGGRLSGDVSKPVTKELIDQCDLILTMTKAQKEALLPYAPDKVYTLMEYAGLNGDISDPFGGDEGMYLACAVQIYDAITKIAEKIEKNA